MLPANPRSSGRNWEAKREAVCQSLAVQSRDSEKQMRLLDKDNRSRFSILKPHHVQTALAIRLSATATNPSY